MILRIVRGRVRSGQLEALDRAFSAAYMPNGHGWPGLVRLHLGERTEVDRQEVVAISFWSTTDGVADGVPGDPSAELGGSGELAEFDPPMHFEIDETLLWRADSEPTILRLTIGRFTKPGSDVEMQNLLRSRLPAIGDELTEAYVGRRIDGRAVEVTFVSAWSREPAGWRLDEPLWPDIALRYDAFWLRTYRPLAMATFTTAAQVA